MARKKLGQILIERGIIDEDQLNSALAYQRHWGHRLGAALLAKGFVTEGTLCKVLGEELGIPVVDLADLEPDWTALKLVEGSFCERHELLPLRLERSRARKVLTVAMGDPLNLAAIEEIEFTTGARVRPVLAPLSQIHSAIRRYYYRIQTQIKRVPEGPARPGSGGDEMIVVRPGGGEEKVQTDTEPTPVSDEDVIELTDEVTQRTEVAELVRQRAAIRRSAKRSQIKDDLDFLYGVHTQESDRLEELERRFWRLMRLLAKKGLLTKEEFLKEIEGEE